MHAFRVRAYFRHAFRSYFGRRNYETLRLLLLAAASQSFTISVLMIIFLINNSALIVPFQLIILQFDLEELQLAPREINDHQHICWIGCSQWKGGLFVELGRGYTLDMLIGVNIAQPIRNAPQG